MAWEDRNNCFEQSCGEESEGGTTRNSQNMFLQNQEDRSSDERDAASFMQGFEDRRQYQQWAGGDPGGGSLQQEAHAIFQALGDVGGNRRVDGQERMQQQFDLAGKRTHHDSW